MLLADMELRHLRYFIAAVEAGRGVAIVSRRMVALAGGRLKVIPLHPAPPPLSVGVAWLEGWLSPVAASFCEIAREMAT